MTVFQCELQELNRRIKEAPTQKEKFELGEKAAAMFRQFFDEEYLPILTEEQELAFDKRVDELETKYREQLENKSRLIIELKQELTELRTREQSAISTHTNAPQEAPAEQEKVRTTKLTKGQGEPLDGMVITERGRLMVEIPLSVYKALADDKKNWLKKNFQYNPYQKAWKAKRIGVTKQALLAALSL